MMKQTKTTIRAIMPALAAAALLALAGCASQPYGRDSGGYGTSYGNSGGYGSRNCINCGRVQSVQQVYVNDSDSNHVLGTIIGAVAGGVLGNTVGKGDGRKAATVAGAVAGGAVGHEVAERNANGSGDIGYRVVVQLDNGRTATVTQRQDPRVRPGDRVQVRNDHVYLL